MVFETGLDSDEKLKPVDYLDSKSSGHSSRVLVRSYSHSHKI
jgi:hypothetical protein